MSWHDPKLGSCKKSPDRICKDTSGLAVSTKQLPENHGQSSPPGPIYGILRRGETPKHRARDGNDVACRSTVQHDPSSAKHQKSLVAPSMPSPHSHPIGRRITRATHRLGQTHEACKCGPSSVSEMLSNTPPQDPCRCSSPDFPLR